jgi:hypothetical protein
MRRAIETLNFPQGVVVNIYHDEHASAPDYMLCRISYRKGSRYTLGTYAADEYERAGIAACMTSGEYIGSPVYAYVHSGVKIVAAEANPFHCQWDSGQSGVAYMEHGVALKEFGTKADKLANALHPGSYALSPETREKVIAYIKGEVESYSQDLSGEVYGIVVEDAEGNDLESCWGFYGLDYATEEAKRMGEEQVKALRKARRKERNERAFWAARGMVTA